MASVGHLEIALMQSYSIDTPLLDIVYPSKFMHSIVNLHFKSLAYRLAAQS